MFASLLKRVSFRRQPLTFEVAGVLQTFDNIAQFGEFLDLRVEVPATTIEQLAALDSHSLPREVRHVSRAYKNAVDIMVRAAETGLSVLRLWHQLDISRAPDDHDWPSILFAVGNTEQFPDGLHRTTLAHYIRYLDARRNIVDSLQHELHKVQSANGLPVVPHSMRDALGHEPRFSTTRHSVYARLPRRRSIQVNFAAQPTLTLYLAHNRYLLKQESGIFELHGQNGESHVLHSGRNTVGRSSQCNIRLQMTQGDISREHLLIEVNEEGAVSLMDLSSRGTYVPPEILPARPEVSVTGSNLLH